MLSRRKENIRAKEVQKDRKRREEMGKDSEKNLPSVRKENKGEGSAKGRERRGERHGMEDVGRD